MGNKDKKFKVQMTKEALYDFMVHHAYTGIAGIFSVIFAFGFCIAGIVMFVTGKISVTYLGCLIFIGVALGFSTPFQLNADAKRAMRKNSIYREPAFYSFSDKGISITQRSDKKFFKWKQILKVRITKKAVGFYYDKQYALVLPRDVFDEQGILEIVKANLPAEVIKQR